MQSDSTRSGQIPLLPADKPSKHVPMHLSGVQQPDPLLTVPHICGNCWGLVTIFLVCRLSRCASEHPKSALKQQRRLVSISAMPIANKTGS